MGIKDTRNVFIDFLKGFSILCVILTHNLPLKVMKYSGFVLWGSMAVPLFFMLQSYHIMSRYDVLLSKGENAKYITFFHPRKIWIRILRPYLILTLTTFLILVLVGKNPINVFKDCIYWGGIGPGSYYIWVYLQIALLCPLLLFVCNIVKKKWQQILIFIIISQTAEFFCISIHIPEYMYRLTCFRYVFLIYLGFTWTKNCISRRLNKYQIILSTGSGIVLIILCYSNFCTEPLLFDTSWREFHWICYFWPAYILPYLLWKFYDFCPNKLKLLISELGRYSYEIFLIQMLVFTIFRLVYTDYDNNYIDTLTFIISTTLLSIYPVLMYKRLKKNINLKRLG